MRKITNYGVPWYAPHPYLETGEAIDDAMVALDWVSLGVSGRLKEKDFFKALHVCAYLASQEGRADKEVWCGRWLVLRDHLVKSNEGAAFAVARRSSIVEEDDRISESLEALNRAVCRFNPWKGVRFGTYVYNVILAALHKQRCREYSRRRLVPINHDPKFEKGNFAEKRKDEDCELYKERLSKVLKQNLAGLTDQEALVLSERYPLDRTKRSTLVCVGSQIGLTKERVRQIEVKALRKIRAVLMEDPVLK